MAEWYEINGQVVPAGTPGAVFHDTDNLAYGDQGDTRYWDGKPGAVGSVTYDRPKDEPGAQPTYMVLDSNLAGEAPIAMPIGGGAPVLITASGFIPAGAFEEPAPTTEPAPVVPVPVTELQTVETCKGTMTVDFLKSQLLMAGYHGPMDVRSMVAAFNRAACGTGSGSTGSSGGSSSGGGNMGFGGGTQTVATKTALSTVSTWDRIQAWAKANPLPAALIGFVGFSMLGGGRRRW